MITPDTPSDLAGKTDDVAAMSLSAAVNQLNDLLRSPLLWEVDGVALKLVLNHLAAMQRDNAELKEQKIAESRRCIELAGTMNDEALRLGKQIEDAKREASTARSMLAEIKDRVRADDDFSADEIVEFITNHIGKLSQGPTWAMNAAHAEQVADLRAQLAERERDSLDSQLLNSGTISINGWLHTKIDLRKCIIEGVAKDHYMKTGQNAARGQSDGGTT